MNWGQLITFATVYEPILDRKFPYITNPSKDEIKDMINRPSTSKSKLNGLRGIVDHDTGKLHIWPENGPMHSDFINQTGHGKGRHNKIYISQYNENYHPSNNPIDKNHLKIANNDWYENTGEFEKLGHNFYNHPQIKKLGLVHGDNFKI